MLPGLAAAHAGGLAHQKHGLRAARRRTQPMYDEPGAGDELGVVWRTEIEDQRYGEVNDAPNGEGGAARGAAWCQTYSIY